MGARELLMDELRKLQAQRQYEMSPEAIQQQNQMAERASSQTDAEALAGALSDASAKMAYTAPGQAPVQSTLMPYLQQLRQSRMERQASQQGEAALKEKSLEKRQAVTKDLAMLDERAAEKTDALAQRQQESEQRERMHQATLAQQASLAKQQMEHSERLADNKVAKERLLPATQVVEQVGMAQAAVDQLKEMSAKVEGLSGKFGPFKGRFSDLNPYDTQAQDLDNTLKTAKQVIGKYLEGGVLRKEDEAKYDHILPKLSDTIEVARVKIQNLSDMLEQKNKNVQDSLAATGYKFAAPRPQTAAPRQAPRPGEAIATPQHSDEAAIDWARKNPDDPRAAEILRMNQPKIPPGNRG